MKKRALKLEVKIPIYAKVIEHIYGTWYNTPQKLDQKIVVNKIE